MAKKVLLKDENSVEILPITRGELILDSSGKQALHSDEFLATTSQPGLMSKEDKSKIDTLSNSTLEISDLLPNGKKIATISVGSTLYNLLAPASYDWSEINNKPTNLSQFTDDIVAGKYLPLSGGTIKGSITLNNPTSNTLFEGAITLDAKSYGSESYSQIRFKNGSDVSTRYGFINLKGSTYGHGSGVEIGRRNGDSTIIWASIDASGITATSFIGNLTGNADSATKLATSRKIWGQSFDGTANINGALHLYKVPSHFTNDNWWASAISARDNSDASLAAFGFLGYGNTLRYVYIGKKHDDPWLNVLPSGNVGIGTTDPSKKLEVNGDVKATSFIGNLDGQYINRLTNYSKATSTESINTSDSLIKALGKLEYKTDTAYTLVQGAYDGDGTIENLAEILKVLEGIKDTETIQAIVGKYLPLAGGTMVGNITFDVNRLIRWHQSDSYSISCPTDSTAAYLLLKGFSGTTINKRLSVYKSDTSTPNTAYTIYTDGSTYASSATFGTVNLGSGDLNFKGADPGDIAWYDADNKEKGRIYYNAGALSLRHDAGTTYKILHTGNARISNGTITINGVSITPLTSKPSYAWSEITGKPTTVAGYGITDTFKIVDDGNAYLNLSMPSAALSKKAVSTYIECWDGGDDAGWWNWKAGKWITVGGTSSHFVKGDGSLDSTTYATSASLSNYLPLTGGTLILNDRGSFSVKRNKGNNYGSYIQYENSVEVLGQLGMYKDSATNTYAVDVYFGNGENYWLIHTGNIDSHKLTTITKSITLSKDWKETGISLNPTNFPDGSGTYAVQVTLYDGNQGFWDCYFSGIMSVYTSYTNGSVPDDEIILHHGSHACSKQIYLKTKPTVGSNDYNKLYIACNTDCSSAINITFKFKKLI